MEAVIQQIIAEHPGFNGGQIVNLAKDLDIANKKARSTLALLPSEPGGGRTRRYYPPHMRQADPAPELANAQR